MQQTIFEITGLVDSISRIKEFSGQERIFKFQDVILKTGGKFETYPQFSFSENQLQSLSRVSAGDSVWIRFTVEGKKYAKSSGETSVFNTLRGQSIGVIHKFDDTPQNNSIQLEDVDNTFDQDFSNNQLTRNNEQQRRPNDLPF